MDAWRWREWFLLLGAVQLPFGYAWIAMSVLLVIALGEVMAGEPVWTRTALDWWLLALLAALVLSGVRSAWPDRALGSTAQFGVGALVVIRAVVLTVRRRPEFASRFLTAVAGSAAVAAALAAAGVRTAPYHRAQLPDLGPNAFATLLAVGLVVAAGLLRDTRDRRQAVWAVALTTMLVALTLTWSRAGWLAAAVGLLALAAAAPGRRIAGVIVFAGLIAAFAATLVAPLWPEQEAIRVDDRPASTHPVSRPVMWRTALRIAGDYPWTGTGFTTFDRVYERYQPLPGRLGPPPHAHNLVLNFAAETGVPGAVTVVAFLASGVGAAWRWRSDSPPGSPARDAATVVLGAVAALLSHQALDGTLLGSGTVFALYALFGLGAAGTTVVRRSRVPRVE